MQKTVKLKLKLSRPLFPRKPRYRSSGLSSRSQLRFLEARKHESGRVRKPLYLLADSWMSLFPLRLLQKCKTELSPLDEPKLGSRLCTSAFFEAVSQPSALHSELNGDSACAAVAQSILIMAKTVIRHRPRSHSAELVVDLTSGLLLLKPRGPESFFKILTTLFIRLSRAVAKSKTFAQKCDEIICPQLLRLLSTRNGIDDLSEELRFLICIWILHFHPTTALPHHEILAQQCQKGPWPSPAVEQTSRKLFSSRTRNPAAPSPKRRRIEAGSNFTRKAYQPDSSRAFDLIISDVPDREKSRQLSTWNESAILEALGVFAVVPCLFATNQASRPDKRRLAQTLVCPMCDCSLPPAKAGYPRPCTDSNMSLHIRRNHEPSVSPYAPEKQAHESRSNTCGEETTKSRSRRQNPGLGPLPSWWMVS